MNTALKNLATTTPQLMMDLRICDVTLDWRETYIKPCADRLHRDLRHAGLMQLQPDIYVGDEWFCPEGSTLISVPFFLMHPTLKKLEKTYVGYAEGSNKAWAMRLLRHEAGHCFDHAYRLSSRRSWQKVFGSPSRPYQVENYPVDLSSDAFVENLGDQYAQSHPEEDFAETFAVVINPSSQWRQQYADCPAALKKLEYVQSLINELQDRRPLIPRGRPLSAANKLKSSLKRYYSRKKLAANLS